MLRFLTGLGMGGVVPNVIALLTESAPKKYRVTFVMVGYIGYSLGNAIIAQVAAWLTPVYGWSVVFFVAGAVGLALCGVLILLLPESIAYLAVKKPDAPELARQVRFAAPEISIDQDTRFVLHRPADEQRFSLNLLFTGSRRIATPLLWIAYFCGIPHLYDARRLVLGHSRGHGTDADAGVAHLLVCLSRSDGGDPHPRASVDAFGPKAAVFSAAISFVCLIYLGTPRLERRCRDSCRNRRARAFPRPRINR